ncbi:heavy metal-associated isoprenylated plant protein 43-like [Ananas comosus]|uniref:Heavy metal-associated isoprenylated plant protein 43-like n=2 Tax=Ananas comosus TaxID=4615 RepID=A0A199W386_ANACO|nr:heavy metal-associated isoprenylated plant protein 43-like [Ananas comosus]OAY83663.1 hypothetical protein ACMD2_08368 [Ananas comosus]CAD1842848.1 unnamed protein product [Ananas comosus var. bracteatus]
MVKRTVLKVDTSCPKCKQKIMQAVSALEGVDKIEMDSAKSTLTVTGNVDPIDVIVRTRKVGRYAEVISVGPPPKPDEKKPDEKKPDAKKPDLPPPVFIPVPSCSVCQRTIVVDEYCHTPCSIL